MKLTKVAFAVASVLAVASYSAHAGQIDSSSATLAIEVIKNNAQVVRAPSKSYNFAGDINATTNEQRLQLQYTLTKGTWAVGGPIFASLNTLTLINPDTLLKVAYTDGANVPQQTLPAGTTVAGFLTDSGRTLVLNVTIPAGGGAPAFLLKQPTFTVNADAIGGTSNAGINNLFAVAGATACVAPDSNLDIEFKHFTNHNGNNTVQTQASPDSEHLRAGSTNVARLLNFTQNIEFKFTPAAAASRTDAATLNQGLIGQNWAAPIVAPAAAIAAPATRHFIGQVNANLRSNGLDLDYTATYGNADNTVGFTAADFEAADDIGDLDSGEIEAKDLTIKLVLPAAWPTGTIIRPVTAAGAAIVGLAPVTTTAGQTEINLVATTDVAMAAIATGVYLFADFPGVGMIPQTPTVSATATLTKDTVAGTPDLREQDNSCAGPLTGIGGGIKIDVRNYAAHATFGDNGPATTVRIINNSEGVAADVYGQLIYADGTYGPWGKLADLKPREVVNMSNKQVEAALVNAPAATNPFGAGTSYTVTSGTAIQGSTKAGISDRLRIVSNSGSTLRVQSYMVVGNTVIDTSNAQGVDFENSGDRVPMNAQDAQPVSQDAINGLSRN